MLLIKELAERLNIPYKIQSVKENKEKDKKQENYYKLIKNGTDVSNYGDPSQWQKNVREDRNIKIS